MKKLLLILLCVPLIGLGQTKTEVLSKKKFTGVTTGKYGLSCKFERMIDLSKSDTTHNCFCTFQNREYQHIVDIGIYHISSKIELDETIKSLKECIKYMDDKSISYSNGNFEIYDFSKSLYIYDTIDKNHYTFLPKKLVLKWINWLEEIQFPQ